MRRNFLNKNANFPLIGLGPTRQAGHWTTGHLSEVLASCDLFELMFSFKLTHNHSQVNPFKGASWRALHRSDRGPRSPSSPANRLSSPHSPWGASPEQGQNRPQPPQGPHRRRFYEAGLGPRGQRPPPSHSRRDAEAAGRGHFCKCL